MIDAIGYPERVPDGVLSFTLLVDGGEVIAEESSRRLRLFCRLTEDRSNLPSLAAYAAGRILREEAALAFGVVKGANPEPAVFLWQEVPADSDDHDLLRFFETFADSCDWWRERVESRRAVDSVAEAPFQEMMIRP